MVYIYKQQLSLSDQIAYVTTSKWSWNLIFRPCNPSTLETGMNEANVIIIFTITRSFKGILFNPLTVSFSFL